MNAIQIIPADAVPSIGTAFEGGFYTGRIRAESVIYGIVTASKVLGGELPAMAWGEYGQDVAGARSFFDGFANTVAMAEAGSELARLALQLNINGLADWYIPSRDELEMKYRAFKPTTRKNWEYRHGDNPSSIPAGYPYTETSPAQTAIELFREGGAEAFQSEWYWTSTQYSPGYAWSQHFDDGFQGNDDKSRKLRARAVRRFIIQ